MKKKERRNRQLTRRDGLTWAYSMSDESESIVCVDRSVVFKAWLHLGDFMFGRRGKGDMRREGLD